MPVNGMIVSSSTGGLLVATRDPVTGALTTTPGFPTLAGGAPIALLGASPTLATVATKVNEIITRLNALIAATGWST